MFVSFLFPLEDVMNTFTETIRFDDMEGRYSIQLPWKKNHDTLPSNINVCKKRLKSLNIEIQKFLIAKFLH